MKRALLALVLLATPLAACKNLAESAANVAGSVAGPTPTQARTLAEAQLSATVMTRALDVAVNTGHLSRAALLKINALSEAVHAAMGALEAADANHQSLDFASFNAALAAWTAYTSANPLPQ